MSTVFFSFLIVFSVLPGDAFFSFSQQVFEQSERVELGFPCQSGESLRCTTALQHGEAMSQISCHGVLIMHRAAGIQMYSSASDAH